MHKENWDDMRYVLAVADHGSVSAAARILGVNHATVLRRVAAFEEQYGSTIFNKTQTGYSVAMERQDVITAMREVDEAIVAVRRVIAGTDAPLRGAVRVTSSDTICTELLPDIISNLRNDANGLRVELISTNAHLDLGRLAADILVRPTEMLPDDILGVCVGNLGFAVYATPDAPKLWLELSGNIARARPAVWLAQNVAPEMIVGGADSFLTLCKLAQAGLGRAILPCIVGDRAPLLERLPDVMPTFSVPLWVGSHEDLIDVPRIRAVRDYLADAITSRAQEVAGSAFHPAG